MKKSELLDQLRLEVGLAFDYASSETDFFKKVLQAIYRVTEKCFKLSLYITYNDGLDMKLLYHLSSNDEYNKQVFGFGFISLCYLRATILINVKDNQMIFAPIFSNTQLKYVLGIRTMNEQYSFSTQDIEFIDELIRFIEAKQQTFE
ncbi:hypothetical protein [Bacillus alkalicola]|uniref:GAF domain-containing protein n=2 Tax=Bacillaceae TaxID=186817 RepID=A0ABS6JQF7_9BACI|nr:hypothetical protein [Bacillus alkalicola]MBU9720502.1 hypothetical protein [Bacillus alkalicola]